MLIASNLKEERNASKKKSRTPVRDDVFTVQIHGTEENMRIDLENPDIDL